MSRIGGGREGARVLALLACLTVTTMAARGQFGPMSSACADPAPSNLPVWDGQEPWWPEEPDPDAWVDRRPTAEIRLRNGNYNDNNRGLLDYWWDGTLEGGDVTCVDTSVDEYQDFNVEANQFENPGTNGRPDQFDWLIAQLQDRYDRGYRRIVLFIPAGVVACQDVPASQWWPMASWRRAWFEAMGSDDSQGVAGWINQHSDVQMGVYMGWEIADPCSLCMVENGLTASCGTGCSSSLMYPCPDGTTVSSHPPDTTVEADMKVTWQNIAPWREIGIQRFWLDASAFAAHNESDDLKQFAYNPALFSDSIAPLIFGGEAFPHKVDPLPTNQRYAIDWPQFAYMPFVISLQDAEGPQQNGPPCGVDPPTDPHHQWELLSQGGPREGAIFPIDFPPKCNGNPVAGWEEGGQRLDTLYYEYICKGFTLWQGGANEFSGAAERIFGFGRIKPGADFDGDGVRTLQDVTRYWTMFFTRQWGDENCTHYNNGFILTYYHGDMNGDGCVKMEDLAAFQAIYNANPAEIWLGDPDTHEMNWNPLERWFPTCIIISNSSSMGP